MDVSEQLDTSHRSEVRIDVEIVKQNKNESEEHIKKLLGILGKMQEFCEEKRNMFMPIREGLKKRPKWRIDK